MAMIPKRYEMPAQAPEIRAHNFDEVALGYTKEMAMEEAQRCLNCANHPCVTGCPVNIHIPEFIAKVKEGNFEEAYKNIKEGMNMYPNVYSLYFPYYVLLSILLSKEIETTIPYKENTLHIYCMELYELHEKNQKKEMLKYILTFFLRGNVFCLFHGKR